jgi:hypothetical protein
MSTQRGPLGWPRLVLRVVPRVRRGRDAWGVVLGVAMGPGAPLLAGVSEDIPTAREAEQVALGLCRVWAALGGRAQVSRFSRVGRRVWARTLPD